MIRFDISLFHRKRNFIFLKLLLAQEFYMFAIIFMSKTDFALPTDQLSMSRGGKLLCNLVYYINLLY